MCVCYWSLVCGVCPYYEVVEFLTRTVTPPKPRLHRLLLYSYSWPAPPSPPAVQCPSGGGSPLLSRHPLHRRPSCLRKGSSAHLSPSQNTDTPMPLPQDTLVLTRKQQPDGDSARVLCMCVWQKLRSRNSNSTKNQKPNPIGQAKSVFIYRSNIKNHFFLKLNSFGECFLDNCYGALCVCMTKITLS